MPRKRTTRTSTKTVVCSSNIENENEIHPDKEEQKKMTISEFDSNVSAAVKDMKKVKSSTESALNKHFQACITAIPPEISHLTLKEFAACGGTFEKALESVKKVNRTNRLAEIQALKCTVADLVDQSQEKENEKLTQLATIQKTLRGKRGRPRFLQTPAITPKFDPNLPATPENIRQMIPGERLMSIAGSPVRQTIARQKLQENLKDCGLDLTPNKMDKILESIATAMVVE